MMHAMAANKRSDKPLRQDTLQITSIQNWASCCELSLSQLIPLLPSCPDLHYGRDGLLLPHAAIVSTLANAHITAKQWARTVQSDVGKTSPDVFQF